MPLMLVEGAIIECSHQGKAKLTGGDGRLSVGGLAVLVSGMEAKISFAPGPTTLTPCPHPAPSGPPGSSPCAATAPTLPAGVSQLLAVGEVGVLLDTANGPAVNPNDPAATWKVADPGQTLLSVDR